MRRSCNFCWIKSCFLNQKYLVIYTVTLLLLLFIHLSFSHQRKQISFHWRFSGSMSPQVSRTLLSILAVFNNAVVWMVSTRPPTSKSSRPFNNPLVTVSKAPITIGIIVTFMFVYYHYYYYHYHYYYYYYYYYYYLTTCESE